MKKIQSIHHLFRYQSGQSLVETAIVAPILIFLLIGVFEVGWALRGYLVLTNVSRETTRWGVRPSYLNYTERPDASLTTDQTKEWVGEHVGYNKMIDHMFSSLSEQLNTTDTLTPALVISHLVIDTKYPCDPADMSTCDCNQFTGANPAAGFTKDDLILHPGLTGYENYYAYTYDPDPTDAITYTSTYSYPALAKQLAAENNKFNCDLLKRTTSATPSPNYVVITEMFYRQPQLFGFPLIANPFTDPVPMFAHTTMRMINSRTGNDLDKVGPVCEAYPITFPQSTFAANPGDYPLANPLNVDIWEGSDPGNFGWITWNPDSSNNNANYLADELRYPRMSLDDYTNATDANDHGLSIGDNVSTKPGVANSSDVNTLLTGLTGQIILIPVYDTSAGTGQNTYYHISHFARVQINSYCLAAGGATCGGQNKNQINATFLGYDDNACIINN